MLVTVPVHDVREVDDYVPHAGEEAVARLREAAEGLKGSRVLHISSTAFGGGVAELIPTQIAIMRDLGIDAEWKLVEGSEAFFAVTKLAHNALQGGSVPWTAEMENVYLEHVRSSAEGFEEPADFAVVHDPQPVALASFLEEHGQRRGKWIWRCHIDLSQPREEVWGFFADHVSRYEATIFTIEEFVRKGAGSRVAIIPPSIDPLSPKNAPLDDMAVTGILAGYGVDRDRPIAAQVSRFDPWKDPLGVIDAYRLARDSVPDLQLILVGSMAHDDPEGWHYLELTEEHRADDPDVHILTNLQDVGALAVNAFQRGSTVIVQKSLREGFGLTVSEAMWKERPVIAGQAGGLRLQVQEERTGYLVDSVEACAERLVALVHDPDLRERMGSAGRERVRQQFLSTRELEDHLRLLASL